MSFATDPVPKDVEILEMKLLNEAARAGNEKASRAVGLANNRNPIPLFIPCHRVIGANGKLTGYRGGLAVKKRLIALEQGMLHANL